MTSLIALAVAVGIFILLVSVLPRVATFSGSKVRTRNIIDRIASGGSQQNTETQFPQDEEEIVASYKAEATGIAKLLFKIPTAEDFYVLLLKAGYGKQIKSVVLGIFVLFITLAVIFGKMLGIFSVVPALVLTWYIPRFYLKKVIRKRNMAFLNMFPEAIDMIVRSVKSGHPINTAMRMIGDNMDPPVGTEFKQVINEVSYGRPLTEALRRLAKRIDEPDVHFFVVVLTVQQETGGNLAEILGNLSNVIRGRKQLNQKIMAMTSEGRATAWVLGMLPVVQFFAIYFASPGYLDPLFTTFTGNVLLGSAIFLILLAVFIVSRMIDVDI